jgi:hypothetical protein
MDPIITADEAFKVSLGRYGVENVTDTAAHAVAADAIQFVTTAQITTVVETGATGNSLNGVTVPQGTVLVGKFTSLTLASGIARMFKSKPAE